MWPCVQERRQQVLGVVTLTGLIFFILTVLGLRRMVIRAIPQSMGYAIAAGIGFFIGFIALRQAGIVVANAHSLVSFGSIRNSQSILFLLGFVLIIVLDQRRFPGAILIGMLVITVVAWLTGQASIAHVMALPPKPATAWTHIDFSPWFRKAISRIGFPSVPTAPNSVRHRNRGLPLLLGIGCGLVIPIQSAGIAPQDVQQHKCFQSRQSTGCYFWILGFEGTGDNSWRNRR